MLELSLQDILRNLLHKLCCIILRRTGCWSPSAQQSLSAHMHADDDQEQEKDGDNHNGYDHDYRVLLPVVIQHHFIDKSQFFILGICEEIVID